MPDQTIPIGRRISLPGHFAEPVVLESVRALGDGFECRVRLSDGTLDEAILARDEAATIFGQQAEAPTSIKPVDAESRRLLVESSRIRLADTHDRHFAVSLSGIRTLPHQIRTENQICVATEAAGEGINLQFCRLMINYDLPWNPMRLEQRLGRIHRIGQERDVHAFNFVASASDQRKGSPLLRDASSNASSKSWSRCVRCWPTACRRDRRSAVDQRR